MMQAGLHIGLAAWINQQRGASGFAVYPASPIAQTLVELEGIQNVNQSAQAAEFARLVNFIPRQGQVAGTFNDVAVLWRVHRDVLARMDHATEPWTRAERATYEAARDVLFTADASGRLAPSMKSVQFDEYRIAYQDLQRNYQNTQIAGTSSAQELQAMAADVARALAEWLVAGFKNEVEAALQVINMLGARSSLTQTQNEALLLNQDPPGIGLRFHGDMEFAGTYFAPISAIARETWMQAKVSFIDLDMAVGNSPGNNQWKAYLANRMGEVTFDYMALNLIRPWYTPALYQRDDWRLLPDGTVVSKGNGSEGLLPAYVETVYLAAVKNVTNAPTPPIVQPFPRPIVIGPRIVVIEPQPVMRMRKPLSVMATSLGESKAMDLRTVMVRQRISDVGMMVPDEEPRFRTVSTVEVGTFVGTRSGQVRKLTRVDVINRHAVLQAYLAGTTWTPPTQPDPAPPQIYVVGFGCDKIPLAPNPNVNYRWD
jgi:hypothetical protein